jgi:hypothetical protein
LGGCCGLEDGEGEGSKGWDGGWGLVFLGFSFFVFFVFFVFGVCGVLHSFEEEAYGGGFAGGADFGARGEDA